MRIVGDSQVSYYLICFVGIPHIDECSLEQYVAFWGNGNHYEGELQFCGNQNDYLVGVT